MDKILFLSFNGNKIFILYFIILFLLIVDVVFFLSINDNDNYFVFSCRG